MLASAVTAPTERGAPDELGETVVGEGTGSRFGVGPDKMRALRARMRRLGIRELDLEESFVRAQGPGGQRVNKVATAVHLKHSPSGTVVKSQSARSQALNRYYARVALADKVETAALGAESAEQQRAAKIRRQKRRRSRRAKARMLADKRHQGDKKRMRQDPNRSDSS